MIYEKDLAAAKFALFTRQGKDDTDLNAAKVSKEDKKKKNRDSSPFEKLCHSNE